MILSAFRALAAGLRRATRSSAILRLIVAILAGFAAGACVTAMTQTAEAMHVLLYGIPFDQHPPNTASGIRLGTPATTSRGFGPDEMRAIGRIIVEAIRGWRSPERRPVGFLQAACGGSLSERLGGWGMWRWGRSVRHPPGLAHSIRVYPEVHRCRTF